jgi:HemY protein
MLKFIFFLLILCGLTLGFSQMAELEGNVSVSFAGSTYDMPIAIAILLILAVFIVVLAAIALIKAILRSPKAALRLNRERKKRKGFEALSQGLLAITAGDQKSADYHAKDAMRLLPQEPLSLLLSAQSQQMQGNVTGAEKSFRLMLERPETKLIGLKGLHFEAERRGDSDAQRLIAEDAVKISPSAAWAASSLIKSEVAAGDYEAALRSIEKQYSARLIDRSEARRLKAVILTARGDENALKEAPDFIPAVNLVARLKHEAGDDKKALKLLSALWETQPNPDSAALFREILTKDPVDRLKRIKNLVGQNEQSALVIARIALDAGVYSEARAALAPFIETPRRTTCLLMAEVEMRESGDHGKSREWTGKALRAKPDVTWMCDGLSYDKWSPASPITGEIDVMKLGEPNFVPLLTLEAVEMPVVAPQVQKYDPLAETLLALPHPPDDPGPKTEIKKRWSLF